ncbi:MAG: maleylpyruvate isomerase family mycothiol-dependent enzyme [Mycobacteriales bacterium]
MQWTNRAGREALAETCLSLADLADTLTAEEWRLPTGCPGWTVFDQVAHVVSLESAMAGVEQPPHTAPQAEHVRNSIGRRMEDLVDARRGWPPERVVSELRDTVRLRQGQLAALDDDPGALGVGPTGKPMPLADHLRMRIFDCLAHELDVRRAVGRPGGLDGAAASVVATDVPGLLPRPWAAVEGVDATVAVDVDGGRSLVRVAGADTGPGEGAPDVVLSMALGTLLALATGRTDADPSAVAISGDEATGRRLVASMALTP